MHKLEVLWITALWNFWKKVGSAGLQDNCGAPPWQRWHAHASRRHPQGI